MVESREAPDYRPKADEVNSINKLQSPSIIPLISELSVPFFFGGTSLLIVVSVTLDTVAQVQSHLLAHQYEGLIKKSKLRGRRG